MNELDLFVAAVAIKDHNERTAFLERECKGDIDLRLRLERLLAGNEQTRHPLDQTPTGATSAFVAAFEPAMAPTVDRSPSGLERSGTVVGGKYMLAELVGEGGMGSVWRAKQTEPVKRSVAVKLIKAGMDSRQVLARFDAERQALALMDHPNIAKVLDGGLHERRPYFVMELVKGVPITEYCDKWKLTPQQRLELFVPVCEAIQHAHQKGIIHRDIKPSNVLVALYDDKPVVKVIDFGVAKATGGALTEATIDTGMNAVVGTPQYMSPEQATLNNLDIDTRSDVYALGVLLYELLTGSTPFAKKDLEKRGLLEILRVVREEEPQRPSTKLSTADALPSISANRGTEPKKLTGLLRNELDWIVMKSLEKDRKRRYETANGFAADVQRYLNGDAVLAHPPSAAYRLKKFAQRNKGQVIAVCLVLLTLAAGIIGTSIGFVQAENRRFEADEARARESQRADEANLAAAEERKAKEAAVTAGAKEKAAKLEAQTNLAYATKANSILGSVFQGLNPNVNYTTVGELRNALRDKLSDAVTELDGAAIGDPLVMAAMQDVLGLSLLGLKEATLAVTILEKAAATHTSQLGDDHPLTLASTTNLAVAYRFDGNHDKALPLLERTVATAKAALGPDHRTTLAASSNLSEAYQRAGMLDKALPLLEETLAIQKTTLGPNHSDTLHSINNLGIWYLQAGKPKQALPLLEESLRLRQTTLAIDHPDILSSMHNLAGVYAEAGMLDRAQPLLEETLKRRQTSLGNDHPDTLTSMNNLAQAYHKAGDLAQGLPMLEETLRLRKAKLGDDHPETLTSMNNLAGAYLMGGKPRRAVPLLEETLKLQKATLGDDHPETLTTMNNLAGAYQRTGKLNLALPLLEETLQLQKAKLGGDHPNTIRTMNNLGMAYKDAEKRDLALPLLEQTLELMKEKIGRAHPETLMTMSNLAELYLQAGKTDLALPLLEETLRLQKEQLGPDHINTVTTMSSLALLYREVGKKELALPLLEETLQLQKDKLGPDHLNTLATMTNLAVVYHEAGKKELALLLFAETFTIQKAKLGPEHPVTLTTMGQLGLSYYHAGKFDQAAPLLEEMLKLQKALLGFDHPTALSTMNNLGFNYKDAGKFDLALPLFEEILRLRKAKFGPDHPGTIVSMYNLASCYQAARNLDLALPLFEETLQLQKAKLGGDHPDTLNTMSSLGKAYGEANQGSKAAAMLTGFTEGIRKQFPQDDPQFAGLLAQVSQSLLEYQQFGAAESLLRECLVIREQNEPDAWTTFNTQNALGGALLGQQKYADAEPLLLQGYEGMKQRESMIPKSGGAELRIPQALDRLIELYTSTNKPDELEKYKTERAKYPPYTPKERQ